MIYLTGAKSKANAHLLDSGVIGLINTPAASYTLDPRWTWAADNGCFGKGYPGDDAYLTWLAARDPARCLFATAPDVVGDAAATLERSAPMLPRIRALGYPAALVAQDGLEDHDIPWDSFDVLFIGGTTEFKTGHSAERLAAEARTRGKRVHMGRVNSFTRLRLADNFGCDSADGTFLAFAPDHNVPRLLGWLKRLAGAAPQPPQMELPL